MDRDLRVYQEEYLANYGFEKFQVQFRRKKVLEILKQYQPATVLEVGCGIESLAGHYTQFNEFTVVEPVLEFIEINQQHFKNSNITYVNKKLENAVNNLSTRRYDFIVVSSLIHELEDPVKMLKVLKGLAGHNTIIHINVPNANSIHRLLGLKMNLLKSTKELSALAKKFQRHREYDLKDLCKFTESLGFKVEEMGSYFVKPLSHCQMLDMIENNKISESFLNALYELSSEIPDFGSEIFVNIRRG